MARRSLGRRKTIFDALLTATVLAWLSPGAAFGADAVNDTLPLRVFSTAPGEVRKVALGRITMQMNTSSGISVSCDPARCEVTVAYGEAFIDFPGEGSTSLHVVAGHAAVDTGGAAFSVHARDAREMEVLVTSGQVMLGQRPVPANSQAKVAKSGIVVRELPRADVLRRLEWRNGHIVFSGETLQEAVTELNRYHARKLVVGDRDLALLTVRGRFRLHDVQGFIETLAPKGVRAVTERSSQGIERMVLVKAPRSDASP